MENVAPFLGEAHDLDAPCGDCANANYVGADALVRPSVKIADPPGRGVEAELIRAYDSADLPRRWQLAFLKHIEIFQSGSCIE